MRKCEGIVNECIIRKTNKILTKYLPMSSCQEQIYKNFLKSDKIRKSILRNYQEKAPSLTTLADITSLKKICGHLTLIYDKITDRESGFENAAEALPNNYNSKVVIPELSGKLMLLDFISASIKANTDDKVVLILNYTQTLDIFEQLCRKRKCNYTRLERLLRSEVKLLMNSINQIRNEWRFALVAFKSAVHNKPSLVRDLLPTLLPWLYSETKIKDELIREVEMGSFQHTDDDELDIRKTAFECMYTFLEQGLDRVDTMQFLDHVEAGLRDHYDIKILKKLF